MRTIKEIEKELIGLGFAEDVFGKKQGLKITGTNMYSVTNMENSYINPNIMFYRSVDSGDVFQYWCYKYEAGKFYYWDGGVGHGFWGTWKPIEEDLSIESIILLYKNITQ